MKRIWRERINLQGRKGINYEGFIEYVMGKWSPSVNVGADDSTSEGATKLGILEKRQTGGLIDYGPSSTNLANDVDIMKLLREKISARQKGGAYGLLRAFRQFKMHGNAGTRISFENFIAALKSYGINVSEERALSLFQVCDTDHDGSINFQEFILHVMNNKKVVQKTESPHRRSVRSTSPLASLKTSTPHIRDVDVVEYVRRNLNNMNVSTGRVLSIFPREHRMHSMNLKMFTKDLKVRRSYLYILKIHIY